MNVKEILNRPAPSILYHYTTQHGLLGIINNKEIWATHTQYLNDVREFRHATDLMRKEVSSIANEPLFDQSALACLQPMREALRPGIESVNVCVCSFSEKGDSLPQWRAYGGPASGFAIGFSGAYLRQISEGLGWLVRVEYDEEQQRLLIRTLLEDVLEENRKRRSEEQGRYIPTQGNLVAYLNRYAPILKHKSFKEESEWRIIIRPRMCVDERFSYRIGPSMLIPYFRLSIGDAEALGIQEIVVGPTPHPKEALASVRGLLIKNEIPVFAPHSPCGVKVRRSEVPFRNW